MYHFQDRGRGQSEVLGLQREAKKLFISRSVKDAAGRIKLEQQTYRAGKLDESLIKNGSHFDKEGLPEYFGVAGAVRKFTLQQCHQSVDR